MQNRPNWSEWILQKNSEAKQEELRKSEFVQLEKAVWEHAPHIAPQSCKCSGASRGDNMHHYSCVDANPKPKPANPDRNHIQNFLDSLNNDAKKYFGNEVNHASHEALSPDIGVGVSDPNKEIEIHSDFGDSSDPDHLGHSDYDDFERHMHEHLNEIHKFMDSLGYEPFDEWDGSGGGLHYGSISYRKR